MDPAVRDQLTGALRIIVPCLLSFAVAKGIIPKESVGPLTEAMIQLVLLVGVPLGAVVWSVWRNSKNVQIDSVAKFPDVHNVVTTQKIANQDLKENPKVTSSPMAPVG